MITQRHTRTSTKTTYRMDVILHVTNPGSKINMIRLMTNLKN